VYGNESCDERVTYTKVEVWYWPSASESFHRLL